MAFYVIERRRGMAGLSGGGISDGLGYDPAAPTGGSQISPKTIQSLMTTRPPNPQLLVTEAVTSGRSESILQAQAAQTLADQVGTGSLPSWVKWGGLGLLVLVGGYVVYRIVR